MLRRYIFTKHTLLKIGDPDIFSLRNESTHNFDELNVFEYIFKRDHIEVKIAL